MVLHKAISPIPGSETPVQLHEGAEQRRRTRPFHSVCHASFFVIFINTHGRVNELHIKAASALMDEMQLHGEQRQEAQNAFRAGKSSDFSIKDSVTEFKEIFARRYDLLQLFLEIQIQMAFSDGHLAQEERKLLKQVSDYLGITNRHFEFILKRYQAEFNYRKQRYQQDQTFSGDSEGNVKNNTMSKPHALAILGLNHAATDKEIKRAYRKLMSQHHPDKLVSQGLPKHLMEVAKRKSQDIQSAYEVLKK